MPILIQNKGLSGRFKISGNSTGGFKARYVGFDEDAQAFFDRVTAAGGSLTQTEKTAVNTMTLSFKSVGVWTLMKAVYPMVGASAAACAQNLKSSSYTGTFSSGWTFASTGVTPNGTTTFMNTGLNPNGLLSFDSFHISYYSRTQSTSFSGGAMGQGVEGGSANTYIAPYYASTSTKFFLNGSYPGNAVSSINTTTTGLTLGNKEAINSRKLYLNATLLATNTTSYTTSFPSFTFYLGALNYSNVASYPTAFQCAFSSIGDGLTDTQVSDFYTAVQAFQTTLGRQV